MYTGFGQLDYETLPADAEVIVPTGTPLVYWTGEDTDIERRTILTQDTFAIRLPEPVDVRYQSEEPEPVPVEVPKTGTDVPWYKTPQFIGGVLSVLAFSAVAFLQSRAEAKVK